MNQEGSIGGGNKAPSGNDSSEDKSPKKPMSYLQEYMAAKQRGDTSKFDIMEKPQSIFGYPVVPDGNVITIRERNEENEIIDVQYVQTNFGLLRFEIVGGERVLVANTPVLTETDTTGLDSSDVFEVPANTGCGSPKEIMLDVKSLITKLEKISSDQSQMKPQHSIATVDNNHNKDTVWKCSKDKDCNLLLEDVDWPPLSKTDYEQSKQTFTRKVSSGKTDFQETVQKTLLSPSKMHMQRTSLDSIRQSQEDIQEHLHIHQSPHLTSNQSKEKCSNVDIESLHNQETNVSLSFISHLSCHSVQELSQIVPSKSTQKHENVTGQVKPFQEKLRRIQPSREKHQYFTPTMLEKEDQYHKLPSNDRHQIQSKSSPEKRLYDFQAPQETQQCNALQSQSTQQLYNLQLQRDHQVYDQQPIEGHCQIQNQPSQINRRFLIQPLQEKLPHWQTNAMQFKHLTKQQAQRQECGEVSSQHHSPEQKLSKRDLTQICSPDKQSRSSPPKAEMPYQEEKPESVERYSKYKTHISPQAMKYNQQHDAQIRQKYGQVHSQHRSPEQTMWNPDNAFKRSPDTQNISILPETEEIFQEEKLVATERQPKPTQGRGGENNVIQSPHLFQTKHKFQIHPQQEGYDFYTLHQTMPRVHQSDMRAQRKEYRQIQPQHCSHEQTLTSCGQARNSSDKQNKQRLHEEGKHVSDEECSNQRQGDNNEAATVQQLQEKNRSHRKSFNDEHQFQTLSGAEKHQFQTQTLPERIPLLIQPFQEKHNFQTQSLEEKQQFVQSQPFQENHTFQTHTSKEKDQIQTRQGRIKTQFQQFEEKQPKWYTQAMQYKQQYEALVQQHENRKLQKESRSPELEQETHGDDNIPCSHSQEKRSIGLQKSQKLGEEEGTENLTDLSDERGSKQQESTKEENVKKPSRITPQEVRERLQQQLEEKQKEVQIQQRMQRQNKPRYDGSRRGGPKERLHSPLKGRQLAVNTSFIRPLMSQQNNSSILSRRSSSSSSYKESDKDETIPFVRPYYTEESRPTLSAYHDTQPQARPLMECSTSPRKAENSGLPYNQQTSRQFPLSYHGQFKERRSSDPLLKPPAYDPYVLSADDRNESSLLQIPQKKMGRGNWVLETNWDSTIFMEDNSNQRRHCKTSVDIKSGRSVSSTDPKIMQRTPHNLFDMPLCSSQEMSLQPDGDSENLQPVDYSETTSIPSRLSPSLTDQQTNLSRRLSYGEGIESSMTQKFSTMQGINFDSSKQLELTKGKQDPSDTGHAKLYRHEESLKETTSQRASSTQLTPVAGIQGAYEEWHDSKTKSFKGSKPRHLIIQQDDANPSKKSTRPLDFWSIPTCPFCHQNFQWPHLLSCLHSFCFRCIIKLRGNVKEKIKCPLCSWPTSVGERGPFDLNLDLNLCSKIFGTVNPFPCTLCSGPGNGVAFCVQCMHFLCNDCRSEHDGSHDLEKVMKFKWSHGALAEMCPTHPGNVGDRYCLDCQTMICILCVRYSEQHVQHTIIKEVEHSKKQIQNMTVDVDRMRDHVRRQMQPMILKKQDIEGKARACKRNIHLFSNDVIEVANKKRSDSRALLDMIHDNIVSVIKRLEDLTTQFSSEYRTLAEFLERYLKNTTPAILLPVASTIRRRYEDMLQKYLEIKRLEGYLKVDLLFSPEFPAVNDIITQSYHFEISESLSELFDQNTDMGFMLHQNMDAILSKNSSDINSQIKDEFADREKGGTVSSDLPVNAVEENEPEQDFSRQGTSSIYSFGENGNGDYSFGEPSGVLYLFNGSLAVCDTANHRIVVYDENYVYERTIGQPPAMKLQQEDCGKQDRFGKSPGCLYFPYRLAQCPQSQNIVVIERPPSRAIQIFDFYGKFLHRFGNDILQHPRGVAVDENGVIVVVEGKTMKLMLFTQDGNIMQIFHLCVYLEFPNDIAAKNGTIYISDNRGHCVHMFDYNGQLRGTIGNESVTYYPIGVSLNFMNNVVVTDNHNTFNITVFDRDGNYQYGYKSRVKHANCYNVAIHPSRCELAVTSRDYLVIIFDYSPPDPTHT